MTRARRHCETLLTCAAERCCEIGAALSTLCVEHLGAVLANPEDDGGGNDDDDDDSTIRRMSAACGSSLQRAS